MVQLSFIPWSYLYPKNGLVLGLTPKGLQVCSGCTSGYISKALRYINFKNSYNSCIIFFFFKVGSEFTSRVKYYALNWYPAREIVLKAIENRYKVDSSGSILVIQPFAPWKSHLFDLEKELNLNNQELKYAMYQDSNGEWRSERSMSDYKINLYY